MKRFITVIYDAAGDGWAGPEILARSWADAEAVARALGVAVVGCLVARYPGIANKGEIP